jgi:sec-independent protein translocase protein TatC
MSSSSNQSESSRRPDRPPHLVGEARPSGARQKVVDEPTERFMGFFGHLDELRGRLMRSLYVFFAGFIGFYFVSDRLLGFLKAPLFAVLPPEKQQLYFTSLFENFLTHLKISGYASLLFLSPYYFYELWKFIAPGLYPRERKWVFPFVAATTVFFLSGAFFAYFVLFPVGFKFFVTYGSASDVPLLTMDSYYSTCLKLMLLFGVAFELPVIVSLLGILGVVSSKQLKDSRRNAILALTIVSAFFAPPDAVSMLILLAPLILMYEGAIWVVVFYERRKPHNAPSLEKAVAAFEQPKGPKENDPWRGSSDQFH